MTYFYGINFKNKSFIFKNSAFVYRNKTFIFETKTFVYSFFRHKHKFSSSPCKHDRMRRKTKPGFTLIDYSFTGI